MSSILNRLSTSLSIKTITKAIRPLAWVVIGLLKVTLLAGVLGFTTQAKAEPTTTCPAGTYDMLDWMTMDADLRSTYHLEGSSNPLYTVMEADKFYWVKGPLGYPWDIQL